MLAEKIAFYPPNFGLPFNPISEEQYFNYVNALTSGNNYQLQVGFDYRSLASNKLIFRSGGYMGSVLIMPVFLTMAAIYFYVLMREKKKLVYTIFTVISAYLLINSISTTAIIAFLLAVFIYELYVTRKVASIFILLFVILTFVGMFLFNITGIFVFNRIMKNISDPEYVNTFTGFSFTNYREIWALIFGRWQWTAPSGVPSHVDFMNIILVYSLTGAYFIYRRILAPLVKINKSQDPMRKAYAMVLLAATICFFHANMTLNINVMILVTLLFLKARDMYAKENNDRTMVSD
jgi:hypothetical protein